MDYKVSFLFETKFWNEYTFCIKYIINFGTMSKSVLQAHWAQQCVLQADHYSLKLFMFCKECLLFKRFIKCLKFFTSYLENWIKFYKSHKLQFWNKFLNSKVRLKGIKYRLQSDILLKFIAFKYTLTKMHVIAEDQHTLHARHNTHETIL